MDKAYYDYIKKILGINCGHNIGIFIDYDNIYHGLRDFGLDIQDDNYNIVLTLWNFYHRDLVRIIRAYADFDQVKVKMRELQKNRVHIKQVYGNGQGEKYRKNASDIELSIEALECFYTNPDIDTYVFVTADSDMIPIMSRMMFKGKKVHLFFIGANTSQYQDITKYANVSVDLVKLYKIDISLNKPESWKFKAIEVIENWYNNSKNKDKLLGAKWLNSELTSNLKISSKLASDIIEYLSKEEIITDTTQTTIKGSEVNGYVLNNKT